MKYAMSDVGIYTLKKQEELADIYKLLARKPMAFRP